VLGYPQGVRDVKLFAIFREPSAKFVSGLYYFARWAQRKRLLSTPPSNFTIDELDFLAMKSLEVRMKAPVHEYTVILGQLNEGSFKWGKIPGAADVSQAIFNLERDVAGAGVLDRIESFTVLVALELGWAPEALPCFDHVNAAPSSLKRDGGAKKFGLRDFRADQRTWIDDFLAAERKVYLAAAALARRQEALHPAHSELLSGYIERCRRTDMVDPQSTGHQKPNAAEGASGDLSENSSQLRISNMKAPKGALRDVSNEFSCAIRRRAG
jgi:hypothetical protein